MEKKFIGDKRRVYPEQGHLEESGIDIIMIPVRKRGEAKGTSQMRRPGGEG